MQPWHGTAGLISGFNECQGGFHCDRTEARTGDHGATSVQRSAAHDLVQSPGARGNA